MKLLSALIAGCLILACSPALAQDDTQPQSGPVEATQPSDDQDDEGIVVTEADVDSAEPPDAPPAQPPEDEPEAGR